MFSIFIFLIFDRLFSAVMKITLPHIFKLLLPVLLVLFSYAAFAQDPQFSQHYANRIYYNPAFTGALPGLRFAVSYRNEWPELPAAFVTYATTVDFQAPCLNSGFGFIFMQDTEGEGALSTLTAGISYAYILRIRHKNREKGNINFGVSAKYIRKWLPNDLVFGPDIDPIHGVEPSDVAVPHEAVNLPDFDAGILSRFKLRHLENTLGFSVAHLTQPDESLLGLNARLPMRFVAHYSLAIPLGNAVTKKDSRFFIMPMLKYEYQNKLMTYNYGLFARAKVVETTSVFAGVSYQTNTPAADNYNTNTLAFHVGIDLKLSRNDQTEARFAYSYDANVTGFGSAGKGAHEISTIWTFGKRNLFKNCRTCLCCWGGYGLDMF